MRISRGLRVVCGVVGVVVLGMVGLVLPQVSPFASAASTVSIPDAGLLKCVDAKLKLPSGTPVTTSQAASVTSLDCSYDG